ncbi:unnamed protein product [Cylindrotheca closterium]|uniref:EamA domain-containing protein n=1 Tax=Cylindrotheca closterium TaxID=2856 RepID=A0AAD2G1G3_9STRA|nr:unnamed protein product [Cylindrotheca closterium]
MPSSSSSSSSSQVKGKHTLTRKRSKSINFQGTNEKTPLMPLAVKSGGGTTSFDDNIDYDDDDSATTKLVAKGRAILCLVAFLYGTLNVSLRLIYQLDSPPTAAALSSTRGWLASVCFVPLLLWKQPTAGTSSTTTTTTTTTTSSDSSVMSGSADSEGSSSKSTSSPIWMAGLELGLWNFLAQGLINVGLLSVGSARASFLTQTSVIMTPLLSIAAGQTVSKSVWVGCSLALGGLTILSGGGGGGMDSASSSSALLAFSSGDILILTGAFSWSLYLFRLSKIAPQFDEINLQAIKTTVLAMFYTIWLGVSLWQNPEGTTWAWATNGVAWLALIYSAVAPGTVADILQQQGQKEVSASEANVILSLEPVFAALCAWLLLGETMSGLESVGGGLILLAALVATR